MSSKRNSNRKRSRPVEPESAIKKFKKNKSAMFLAIFIVLMMVLGSFYVIFAGNNTGNDENLTDNENPIAIIDTSMGTIRIELYRDKVPNTVDNFISYVNDGFYEGLVFHRVIDGFMIQGGGFYPDGTQKQTNDPIDLEIHEDVRHVDGAIAMARTNDPNSATSQFYICDGAQSFLDDNYAAFGVTIEGIEIVREIASLDPDYTTTKYGMENWPVEDVIINSITIEEQLKNN